MLVATRRETPGCGLPRFNAATTPDDYQQLVLMLEQAEERTGERADITLADGGYHSGQNLQACADRGQTIVMPEGQREAMKRPYFKDRFEYDAATDSYTCPEGQHIPFRGLIGMKALGSCGCTEPPAPSPVSVVSAPWCLEATCPQALALLPAHFPTSRRA